MAISVHETDTVTQEAAGCWVVRKRVDAGDRVERGQGRELVPSGDEESIRAYHESVNVQSTDGREGRIDVERVSGCHFMRFDPEGASRHFHIRHFGLGPRVIRIDDHGDGASVREQIADQFKPLRRHLDRKQTHAG